MQVVTSPCGLIIIVGVNSTGINEDFWVELKSSILSFMLNVEGLILWKVCCLDFILEEKELIVFLALGYSLTSCLVSAWLSIWLPLKIGDTKTRSGSASDEL